MFEGLRGEGTMPLKNHKTYLAKSFKKILIVWWMKGGCNLWNSKLKISLNWAGYLRKFLHDDDEK